MQLVMKIALTVLLCVAAGARGQQCQLFSQPSPQPDSRFGHRLAVVDGLVYIAAPYEDDGELGVDSGAVYVYRLVGGELELLQHIRPPERSPHDWFGSAIAVEGDTLVIGASGDDDNYSHSGSVFVYGREGGLWVYRNKIIAHNGTGGDGFGAGLAIGDGLLAVGAPGMDSGPGPFTGQVYVYELASGELRHELVGADSSNLDGFGRQLVMGDGLLFIGVPGWDSPIPSGNSTSLSTGAVYVFDAAAGEELLRFSSGREHYGQAFGCSLAYEDGQLLVGAMGEDRVYDNGRYDGSIGAVYHYQRNGEAWDLLNAFVPEDVVQYDRFGSDIAVRGGRAVISSPSCTSYCTSTDGKVYIYDLEEMAIIEKYTPSGVFQRSAMGAQVEMIDEYVIVASEQATPQGYSYTVSPSGACAVFDRSLLGCAANIDNDCAVTGADVDTFLAGFVAGDPVSDFNTDGRFNYFDIAGFVDAFVQGCP